MNLLNRFENCIICLYMNGAIAQFAEATHTECILQEITLHSFVMKMDVVIS